MIDSTVSHSPHPILHLMNGVGDASITSMVVDQLIHFGNSGYEWHIAGLKGVASNEPFSHMGAAVVDFSRGSFGQLGIQHSVRRYVHQHGIQLVHCHTPRTTVTAALALRKRRGVKLLTTKHSHTSFQDRKAHSWLFWCVDRFACYLPDHIIAVSQDLGIRLQALPFFKKERITVIQNAVDTASYYVPEERERCRAEFGIGEHETVLGFAGRLVKLKRLDLMLQAFSRVLLTHANCRLLLAGAGEEEPDLRSLASQLGIAEKVIWAGQRSDMPRLYAAMDIYVQSSDNEAMSLSLLQAMVAQKAIVATDVGGTRELVSEQTGILVPAGSAHILAEAIIRLLDQPAYRDHLVKNASDLVSNVFSVSRQMKHYQTIYEQLLSDQK